VISITDGQIYLETELFNSGVRPAVNAGLSVSRVGGAAQIKAMRQVAGRLRLELAGFRSLAAFAQFGSDLDADTRAQIDRGQRLTETLKQGQYKPLPVEEEVVAIWTATNGYLDDVAVTDVRAFENDLLEYMRNTKADLLKKIATEKAISDEIAAALATTVKDFKSGSRFTSAAAD
ncbi:MAG TPA: F0F1 ATP synthase subunit alpha, partial [Thermomicrobiales bacterium]|nr:F0F1 ATP synthase subunit alpha [Thermomicrobiales bacterium]